MKPVISDITLTPNPVAPGAKVKGTCRVTDEGGDLKGVELIDPRGWVLKLYDDGTHGDEVAGDGIYTLEETVPYDAPYGTYTLTIRAYDEQGNYTYQTAILRIG